MQLVSIYYFVVLQIIQIKNERPEDDQQFTLEINDSFTIVDAINCGVFALIILLMFSTCVRLFWSDPGYVTHGLKYNPTKLSDTDLIYYEYVQKHKHDTDVQGIVNERGGSVLGSIRGTFRPY